MARARRITVRLADLEIQSVRKFADENHVLPSVAVRWLLSVGLADGKPHRGAGCPPNKDSAPYIWLTGSLRPYDTLPEYRRRLLMTLGICDNRSSGLRPNFASERRVFSIS